MIQKNNWKIFFEHDLNVEACTIKKVKNNYSLDKTIIINE